MCFLIIIVVTLLSCERSNITHSVKPQEHEQVQTEQIIAPKKAFSSLESFMIAPQQPHVLPLNEVNPDLHGNTASLLWTSKHLTEDLGSDIIKLSLSNNSLKKMGYTVDKNTSLTEIAQHEVYKKSLALPYRLAFFWAHGKSLFKYYTPAKNKEVYKEFYDFTTHLLTTYNGSGKTFMIGNWEGDWLMGGKKIDPNEDMPQDQIDKMISWMNIRGKAIEDAKKATAHQKVDVLFYAEVNLVRVSRKNGLKRMTNSVLPHCKHLDYVSVSSYETQNINAWKKPHTEASLKDELYTDLNYVESFLQERPGIIGRRVGIGEIGYPIVHVMSSYNVKEAEAELIQARLALLSAKVNLEWGTPFWLWWGIHHNEENKMKKYSNYKFKGFGIIDQRNGHKTRLWHEFYTYNKWATKESQTSSNDFKDKAIDWLNNRIAKIEREISLKDQYTKL